MRPSIKDQEFLLSEPSLSPAVKIFSEINSNVYETFNTRRRDWQSCGEC
jgi:hypothetical protein